MKACDTCGGVYDVAKLPVVTTDVPARSGLPAFKQDDVYCPSCGALLSREIDGKAITANHKDERGADFAKKVEVAKVKEAAAKAALDKGSKASKGK